MHRNRPCRPRGVGKRVISDSRSGEYQLGDGHRYSRMMFRDEAAKKDAEQAAVDPQFEALISKEMAEEGVEYYGRLVMAAPGAAGGWFAKSRYGSLEDVQKGTWLIKEILFKEEMARWFSSYETIMHGKYRLDAPRDAEVARWYGV